MNLKFKGLVKTELLVESIRDSFKEFFNPSYKFGMMLLEQQFDDYFSDNTIFNKFYIIYKIEEKDINKVIKKILNWAKEKGYKFENYAGSGSTYRANIDCYITKNMPYSLKNYQFNFDKDQVDKITQELALLIYDSKENIKDKYTIIPKISRK